jgi:V-type H+-transporting ATPase subunit H
LPDAPLLAKKILEQPEPYKHFLGLLSYSTNPEDPVPLLSAAFLTGLVAIAIASTPKPKTRDDEALSKLYSYLSGLVKNQDNGLQDIGVQQISALLLTKRSKELFWEQKAEAVTPLFDILRKAAGAAKDNDSTLWSATTSIRSADTRFGGGVGLQLMYHVLLVIWQLSFEGKMVGEGLERYVHPHLGQTVSNCDRDEEVVPLYTQLLRMSPKEKTTRLLLSTLNNLLSANKDSLIAAATTARLPAMIGNLGGRHWADPDLLEDLENLNNMLEEYTKNQTTFDEYADEVNSGHLRWSPPHRNPTFWRENARKILEDKQGELPKKLAEIIDKPWDSDKKVLAIACNDIGNLVKEVPEQRNSLEKLGLKARVMELMTDKDESVRWESLRAVGEWMRYTFGT